MRTQKRTRDLAPGSFPPKPPPSHRTARTYGSCSGSAPGALLTSSCCQVRSPGPVVTARSMRSGTSSKEVARCGGAMAASRRWWRSSCGSSSRSPSARPFRFEGPGTRPGGIFAHDAALARGIRGRVVAGRSVLASIGRSLPPLERFCKRGPASQGSAPDLAFFPYFQ